MNYLAGELAKKAKVNVETLRYYERNGLLKPHHRNSSGYRVFTDESLKRLKFIRKAKDLGFSLKETKELFGLKTGSAKSCDRVRLKAISKLKDVEKKIKDLRLMENTLQKLVDDCENRVISDSCPIIETMEA